MSPSDRESGIAPGLLLLDADEEDEELLDWAASAADLEREPPDSALAPSEALGEEVVEALRARVKGREREGVGRAARSRRAEAKRCMVAVVVVLFVSWRGG